MLSTTQLGCLSMGSFAAKFTICEYGKYWTAFKKECLVQTAMQIRLECH